MTGRCSRVIFDPPDLRKKGLTENMMNNKLGLFAAVVALGLAGQVLAQAENAITVSNTSVSLSYTLQSEKVPSQTITVGTTGASTNVAVSVLNVGTPSPFVNVTPGSCP